MQEIYSQKFVGMLKNADFMLSSNPLKNFKKFTQQILRVKNFDDQNKNNIKNLFPHSSGERFCRFFNVFELCTKFCIF
jgi:hypothetical protein